MSDGTVRSLTKEEMANIQEMGKFGKLLLPMDVRSSGYSEAMDFPVTIEGKTYRPSRGKSWKTTKAGMENLIKMGRLFGQGNTLRYKLYFDDYPISEIKNIWLDTRGEVNRVYVVQTSVNVIERCIAMTTDPGDLVFDPTCGSGTTAFGCEQTGRRWVTCDTSRVSIALTKQRLLTTVYEHYNLARPSEGITSGFLYKKAPHVTLGSLANNEPAGEEFLYDQPAADKSKVRVTGPFTVEASSGPSL